ncbi:MAG: alpha-2-macroglobulin [Moraxellaceae bacterium]|nr:MAG: alpha-2-macroglobulin [Moraxellaceae bacterium]
MKSVLFFPFKLVVLILGRWRWDAPSWLVSLGRFRRSRPGVFYGVFSGAVLALILTGVGYHFYQMLPQPITVMAEVSSPRLTANKKNAEHDNLQIAFVYDYAQLHQDQPQPEGVPSVARIDLVGEKITQGVSLSPAKKGQWQWLDDRRLQFQPDTDWPPGIEYTVTLDEALFSSETRLSENVYPFRTEDFSVEFAETEFYQDPQNLSVRRVVSTIRFSHPVDKQSFEKNITMGMRPSNAPIEADLTPYLFEITYDENQREAYLTSEPLSLPVEPNYMTVVAAADIKSLLGGPPSKEQVSDKVLIPDLYSFLKVSAARTQIVRNQSNDPEQVLLLEFTDDLAEQELLSKLSVYLLPYKDTAQSRGTWRAPGEVTEAMLASSEKLSLTLIPNARNYSKRFNFIFDVPEGRQLYVKINAGFKSVNKFVHGSLYHNVLATPNYPKEVDFAGEGSVLTFSGDHKLSVLTRGVSGLQYRIGKLLNNQIYHLVSQTRGDISHPDFKGWQFDSSHLSEFETKNVILNTLHPKRVNYSSLDLSQYLPEEKNRFGLFFVDVKGWDPVRNREIYRVNDSRLILVTDLGLIVKNNADQSHELFIQSIQTGDPVSGARVELLGKNGVPIFSQLSSERGHVSIPVTKDFDDEKTPTVYVVKTDHDLSFIPFNRHSRQINLSRFDIGGIKTSRHRKDSLNSYLFTDRGIYRPGEEVNIGAIVKQLDLSSVEGIPLEIIVRGPRHNEVNVTRILLPEKGFFDFKYPTQATSDTGRYQVSLHLVRDNKHRGRQIGDASFRVEEFQPDTLKIESKLTGRFDKGWNTDEVINAAVTLNNLFGVPAQGRKMTGRVIINPAKFSFNKFKEYYFTDPYISQNDKPLSLSERLATQKTDVDGKAEFAIDLQRFRAGTYQLQFIAEGFDQGGGRSVLASNHALISPLPHLIGYKADGALDYINSKSQRTLQFIAIDPDLKQIALPGLRIKQLEIESVSSLVKQRNGTYQYQTVKKENQLSDAALEIAALGHEFVINTAQPGDFAVEIYDAEQRRLSRVEYSVVGVGNLAGKIDKNAELQVKLNKKDYLPGELIEMSIRAPYSGAGLISIETNKVHSFKWFKTDTESSVQTIQMPKGLEGNGYVNVTFVRDVGSEEIFTSPLSYAVQPFSIDQSKHRVEVELTIDDIVRPGKPMTIGFKTSKPSKLMVFAVDEGILQVARYTTPDPLGHFLKKRALDVDTLQILDLILPEFALLKQLSATGGGVRSRAVAKNLNPFARSTDKPAVFWSGIMEATEALQTVTFEVPNSYAGSLVVMAVAVADESMGVARDSTVVRGPFVISPHVLIQAAPGDEFWVTVGVANLIEGSGEDVPITLEVSASKHLTLMGKTKVTLTIDEGGEGKARFKVKAKQMPGSANLKFTATHKDEVLSRSASLSVRPATPYYSHFESGFNNDSSLELVPQRSMRAELSRQFVSASASPLVLVDGLSSYLDAFPHGCTEQVVSKVFPLVGLMSHPAYASYASYVPKVTEYFDHLITQLRARQMSDGGFSFWPGGNRSVAYPTIYVMHFLIEARDQGYPVPSELLVQGQSYLRHYVAQPADSLSEARDRANAIYLLTRLGEVTTNYLVDLEEYLNVEHPKTWQRDLLSSYMAATYQLLKKEKVANALIQHYEMGAWGNRQTDDFHSELAQDAQYVYLLAKHFHQQAKDLHGEEILQLTDKIFKGQYNTISAAYSILALGAYSEIVTAANSETTLDEVISFVAHSVNRKDQQLVALRKPFLSADYSVETESLTVNGDQALYYLNVQSGYDREFPGVVKQGIEIQRDFLDEDGQAITSFEQGQNVTVRIRVRALEGKQLSNIAIVDLLPGGFEVIRDSVSRTAYNWRADYVDVREDRVVYYGDFGSSVRELSYKVKLSAAGEFVIPPTYAESMYDRSIRAISAAGKFIVLPSS